MESFDGSNQYCCTSTSLLKGCPLYFPFSHTLWSDNERRCAYAQGAQIAKSIPLHNTSCHRLCQSRLSKQSQMPRHYRGQHFSTTNLTSKQEVGRLRISSFDSLGKLGMLLAAVSRILGSAFDHRAPSHSPTLLLEQPPSTPHFRVGIMGDIENGPCVSCKLPSHYRPLTLPCIVIARSWVIDTATSRGCKPVATVDSNPPQKPAPNDQEGAGKTSSNQPPLQQGCLNRDPYSVSESTVV